MRSLRPVLVLVIVVPVLAAPPPLSLEGFLDEELPVASAPKVVLPVDNAACYVCHDNFDGEELVVVHGKEEIGCVDCHGESAAHRNDEDNITPPEKMYAPQFVDALCLECHDTHDAPARDVIRRMKERVPPVKKIAEITCTDCHYAHRLARRTVKWNKKTGKLLDTTPTP